MMWKLLSQCFFNFSSLLSPSAIVSACSIKHLFESELFSLLHLFLTACFELICQIFGTLRTSCHGDGGCWGNSLLTSVLWGWVLQLDPHVYLPLFLYLGLFFPFSVSPFHLLTEIIQLVRKRRRDDEAGELTVSEISDNQLTVDEMQRVGRGRKASKSREGEKE